MFWLGAKTFPANRRMKEKSAHLAPVGNFVLWDVFDGHLQSQTRLVRALYNRRGLENVTN